MVRTCTILTRKGRNNFLTKNSEKMSVSSILGIGAGIISNMRANETNELINQRQLQNQRDLLNIQQRFSAEQAEKADERTRALYKDFMTPEAQRRMLEEAGLSVGMMYGSGGVGGNLTSGAQANTPSATAANQIGYTPLGMEMAAILAQQSKINAETENIKSQTELNKAELPKKQAEIDQIRQNIENLKQSAKESQQKIENMIQEKLKTAEETKNYEKQRELWQAQTKYVAAQEKLEILQAEWLPKMNQKQIDVWNATIKQMNAAAEKLGIEKEILKEQKESLVKKLYWEALEAQQIYQQLTPQQIATLRAESNKLNFQNITEKQLQECLERIGMNRGVGAIWKTIILTLMKIVL